MPTAEPHGGGDWDRNIKEIKSFKHLSRKQLNQYQKGRCPYCGLLLDTRSPELEHIAPKGGPVRPQHIEFTFLSINLVLACRDCNKPERKGTKDTILVKREYYSQCEFSIVHPYLDDPNDYFEYIKGRNVDYGIIPKPKTGVSEQKKEKAKNTIAIFGLDSEGKFFREHKMCFTNLEKKILSKKQNDRIEAILSYRYLIP